jgi:hypothetical protein
MTRRRRIAAGTVGDAAVRRALGSLAAATVRLLAVDPITTEIVRLRCADHHDCGT